MKKLCKGKFGKGIEYVCQHCGETCVKMVNGYGEVSWSWRWGNNCTKCPGKKPGNDDPSQKLTPN